MKKIAFIAIAILAISIAEAQTTDSFCIVMNKIMDLGKKNKIGELKGDKVDREMLFADVHYYKSTLEFPGFTDPEIRQLSANSKFSFGAHILYDNDSDMMSTYKATQKQIQNCLTASHQKFETTSNTDADNIWWHCKEVRINLHYYVSGGIYVVDLSFDPNY